MSNEVNKILLNDERSLPEIWNACNDAEKDWLRRELKKKFRCTDVTVWNWTKGNTTPPSFNDRELIARIVNRGLKVNTTAGSLFPR